MPKITRCVARIDGPKSCPSAKKGDVYYWWKHRRKGSASGFFRCTVNRAPRKSELTMSEYMGTVYAIVEEMADAYPETEDDFEALRQGWIEQITDLTDEQQERHDNLPENFKDGVTGALLLDRVDDCQTWISEIEAVAVEELDRDDYDDEDDYARELAHALRDAIEGCLSGAPA